MHLYAFLTTKNDSIQRRALINEFWIPIEDSHKQVFFDSIGI